MATATLAEGRIVIPAGPVTPHGCCDIREGHLPMVSLVSPNNQIVLWLMGGQSKPDPMQPESVQVKSLSGLIAPFEPIDQQGATQDGVTFVDALYEPIDILMNVDLFARDAKWLRWLRRKVHECLDIKVQSELGWMTPELGYWWAPVRWAKVPVDQEAGPQKCHQSLGLRLRVDNAFWQSFPDTDMFKFVYDAVTDTFSADYSDVQNCGPNWPQLYSGDGVGCLYANGKHALWSDDPDRLFFTSTRGVVCGPYAGYSTSDDAADVAITFDNTPEFALGSGAANDIWVRMGRLEDGSWDGNGVRARIGFGYCRLSVFRDFAETVLKTSLTMLPPLAGQTYRLTVANGSRRYHLKLDGWDIDLIDTTDGNSLSHMGSGYRGVGFGMQGGAKAITQATPGRVRAVTSGGDTLDTFGTDIPGDLGADWPLRYSGRNDAYIRAASGNAVWVDNSGTETQEVVCGPYKDFDTETDCQVVAMELGSYPEASAKESGANDLWARMSRTEDGTWAGDGIRLRCTPYKLTLTAFVDFEPIWTREKNLVLSPHPGDKWVLVAGYTGDPRLFKVQRNGAELLAYKEVGAGSLIGEDYRGVGWGVRAGGASIQQATPANVRKISAGDNADVTQTGFLKRHNGGDQTAYDTYTVYGPGIIGIANGPGSDDMVEIGPLAEGEIAFIRTDPRRRGVFDFTERTGAESASVMFGASPTDTMYRKLKGRFTSECAIPGKEPGMRVATHLVKVTIRGGNADSQVMASLTPLRRYPQ